MPKKVQEPEIKELFTEEEKAQVMADVVAGEENSESSESKKAEGRKDKLIRQITVVKPKDIFNSAQLSKKERTDLRYLKSSVKELERNNYDKIFLFDTGWPWYTVAFNSMLIYKYRVQPYLEREYFHQRKDNDFDAYSHYGVISVIDPVAFGDGLHKLGAKVPEELRGFYDGSRSKNARLTKEERKPMYVFDLSPLHLTLNEIRTYIEEEERAGNVKNELILPNYIPQELYRDLFRLAPVVADIVKRLPSEVKLTIGTRMHGDISDTITLTSIACKGYGGREDTDYIAALNMAGYLMTDLQTQGRIIEEGKFLKPGACNLLAKMSILVEKDLEEELEKMYRAGSKAVRDITNMKNFPKKNGISIASVMPEVLNRHGFIKTMMPQGPIEEDTEK